MQDSFDWNEFLFCILEKAFKRWSALDVMKAVTKVMNTANKNIQ